MRFAKILVIIMLAALISPLSAENLKIVQMEDPVYLFLDKGYAKGWINYIPYVKPYTTNRILEYLGIIGNKYKTDPEKFSDIDISELDSHIDRLSGNNYSLIKATDGEFRTELNIAPHTALNTKPDSISDTAFTLGADLSIDLHAGDSLYLGLSTDSYLEFESWEEAPYRKFYYPKKPDFNMYTVNLDSGGQSFNHDAAHAPGEPEISIRMNQLNQTTIDANIAMITFGRNSLSWGPSQFANLALSSTSSPYEYFSLDIPIGEKIYFTWMTGFLKQTNELWEDTGGKQITGHRFEYQVSDWFMFSFYETVVYSERFELAYINPFSLYYISEVNQGDLDNKMGGFDFLFRFDSSNIYLSLFVDDWDFGELFNPAYFHNEMGTTLGYRNYSIMQGLTLTAEYTYLNHWVYTHKTISDSSNNYTHYGTNLGHPLQPNSHMIYLDLRYDKDVQRTFGLSFWFTQNGYGDVYTHAHDGVDWDMDGLYEEGVQNYKFLDFGVDGSVRETNIDATIYSEYRIPFYGIKLYTSYSIEHTWNKNLTEGDNGWDHILTLSGKWQAY